MRTKVIGALCALLISGAASAQVLVNGQFNNCCVNNLNFGGCPTFDSKSVPNWDRSHGSPEVVLNASSTAKDDMSMQWSNTGTPNRGDGIMARFKFLKGVEYKVVVNVRNFVYSGSGNTFRIEVRAFNGYSSLPVNPTCVDGIPGPILNGNIIGFIQPGGIIGGYNARDFTFCYRPEQDYEALSIFPYNEESSPLGCIVGYVSVESTCKNRELFADPNVVIPAGTYDRTSYIQAGTLWWGSLSGTVRTDASQNTTFLAGSTVELEANFEASADRGGTFYAGIQFCPTCDRIATKEGPGGGDGAATDRPNEAAVSRRIEREEAAAEVEAALAQSVGISPNPFSDQFVVALPGSFGGGTLRILDLYGRVVAQTTINGQQSVRLSSTDWAPGMYQCIIDADGHRITKTIMKASR